MSTIFPRWMNAIPTATAVLGFGALVTVAAGITYYFTPEYWRVGYEPVQPVDYSHQLHAGTLGIDCRYCHTHVEESGHSNVPDTGTCMNCHTGVGEQAYLERSLWQAHLENPNLVKVREAHATGEPIRWRRVHKVPDYAHFNHSVHVNAGVSCYSCHGRIDQQAVVRQVHGMGMAWCLECHRNPEDHLVDTDEVMVTDLNTVEQLLASADQPERGLALAEEHQLQPPQNCGACHY